jgi:hypothetical protein
MLTAMDATMEQMKDPAYVNPELAEVGYGCTFAIPSADERG